MSQLDLSSLIYLLPQSHPAPLDHKIILFSLAELSNIPPEITDEELFEGLMERCAPWVEDGPSEDDKSAASSSSSDAGVTGKGQTGKGQYVLIILAAEGKRGEEKKRGMGSWIWRYRNIPRSFKKNLKRMYIVHPSSFTRTILSFVLPFLSPKSYTKIYPTQSLLHLAHNHSISLSSIKLTIPLLEAEGQIIKQQPELFPWLSKSKYPQNNIEQQQQSTVIEEPSGGGWFGSIWNMAGNVAGYLPYGYPKNGEKESSTILNMSGYGYIGRNAEDLVNEAENGVLELMMDLREAISEGGKDVENIFRTTPGPILRPPLLSLLDLPISSQPVYPWSEIMRYDPYTPPKIFMKIFSSSPEPYIPVDVYPIIRGIRSSDQIREVLFPKLGHAKITLLSNMISLFQSLLPHQSSTHMSALAYAIVFAPDLISGSNPLEDLATCLEPGKKIPSSMGNIEQKDGDNTLVGVLELWIKDCPRIMTAWNKDMGR